MDKCPVCNVELGEHAQSPRAHLEEHFGGIPLREMSREARKSYQQLADAASGFPPDQLPE